MTEFPPVFIIILSHGRPPMAARLGNYWGNGGRVNYRYAYNTPVNKVACHQVWGGRTTSTGVPAGRGELGRSP